MPFQQLSQLYWKKPLAMQQQIVLLAASLFYVFSFPLLFCIQLTNIIKLMSQAKNALTTSQSNMLSAYSEEEQICKAFQINNFYLNDRFNIKQLKQKIEQRKQRQNVSSALKNNVVGKNIRKQFDLSPEEEVRNQERQEQEKRGGNIISRIGKERQHTQGNKRQQTHHRQKKQRNYILLNKEVKSHDHTAREEKLMKERYHRFQSTNKSQFQQHNQKTINYRINKPALQRQRIKTLLQEKGRDTSPFYDIESRIKSRLMKSKLRMDDSRFSGVQTQQSYSLGVQGKISISSKAQLIKFEEQILFLWEHYELLSRILEILPVGIEKAKPFLTKYRDSICTHSFQFIRQALQQLCEGSCSKKQSQFLKRLKKNLIASRLFQHLSVLFLAMQLYLKSFSATHLTNLIGYASSNLINTIKLLLLSHEITPFSYSSSVQEKILIIDSFQVGSYGSKLNRISQVLLRIEQNNNVMGIIKNKLDLDKEFLSIVNSYIKMNDIQTKTLQEYSHYIFQYFAFTIASWNLIGVLESFQIAPAPYLALPKAKTLVIEPWHVLFSMKSQATFIRAYSDQFLNEISQHCNIVYWTDLMPNQINTLLDKMPVGCILYRYHCKFKDGGFMKQLARLGSDLDNTVIIDRSSLNFREDIQMGIELPWNGTKRDMKLLNLLETFQLLYQEGCSFRQGFAEIKDSVKSKNLRKRIKTVGQIRANH